MQSHLEEIKDGGLLKIKVKEARLFRDTETFGKMDPYCILQFPYNKYRTKTHKNGGKNPKWTDEFEVRVVDLKDEIKYIIMDEDLSSDDTVGVGVMKISSLCINSGITDWFSIFHENKPAGQVLLETKYI